MADGDVVISGQEPGHSDRAAPLSWLSPTRAAILAAVVWPRKGVPQPLLGIVLAILALCCLAAAWADTSLLSIWTLTNAGLALALAVAAVLANIYPFHITRSLKVSLLTIPVFLLAVLTPPALAATGAGIAVLIGELIQRPIKGSLPSDIAATTGRWTVNVLLSSIVAHTALPLLPAIAIAGLPLPIGAPLLRLPLFLAAAALFLGDIVTGSLEVAAMTGEPPHRVIRMIVAEVGATELIQYSIAVVGALAARADAWTIVLLLAPVLLVRRLLKYRLELHAETRSLLESMADAVDLRDPYTGGHSQRVTTHAAAILRALNMSGPEVALITAAARVHDIGKIAMPDRILNKPDRLTDEERAEMESHPQRGADFLARYPDFHRGIAIVLHHHERIDGKGYPHGLSGAAIPFGARVIAVADSYDAMTSNRPYRQGMPSTTAAAILLEGRTTQWDSLIVDAFVADVLPTLAAGLPLAPSGDA